MFDNIKVGSVNLDGTEVAVISKWKIHAPKKGEYIPFGFKKRSVRLVAKWEAYEGYEQHVIADFSLNFFSLFLPTGSKNFQEFLDQNIVAKYLERKKLGHGIKPYGGSP